MDTIKSLVTGESAITQLDIFIRADRMLPEGRYYAGSLTPELVKSLTEGLTLKRERAV